MDYYDSTYSLEHYKIGEKYIFHRNTTNKNYWLPKNEEEEFIYNTYVAKYLNGLPSIVKESVGSRGVTEVQNVTLPGVTEVKAIGSVKGVTEDKGVKDKKPTKNVHINSDEEGELVNHIKINKEVGTVVGIYDGPEYKLLTVVFDDGKVLDYIIGTPVFFNQKKYETRKPKLPVNEPGIKRVPLSLQKQAEADGLFTDKKVGITEKKTDKKAGITEKKTDEKAGITED